MPAKPPQWMPRQLSAVRDPPEPVVPRGRGPTGPVREAKTAAARQECIQPDVVAMPPDFKGVLSVGSVGHPYTCKEPCKYVRKSRGCKDGAKCDRCHACIWSYYRRGKPDVEHGELADFPSHARPQSQ